MHCSFTSTCAALHYIIATVCPERFWHPCRFILIFFFIYVIEYFLFALLYLWQPNHCIPHIKHLRIALWFSVQTAATIGAQGAEKRVACGLSAHSGLRSLSAIAALDGRCNNCSSGLVSLQRCCGVRLQFQSLLAGLCAAETYSQSQQTTCMPHVCCCLQDMVRRWLPTLSARWST
jgi:hypothetical protein